MFRDIAKNEGGRFAWLLELPNHVSYDQRSLRDEHGELEDVRTCSLYEEENLEMAKNQEDSGQRNTGVPISQRETIA